ncbi:MAG: CHC2 zinc finger domain-containing protein [Sphingomonadaceae bacterium]
MNAQIDFSAVNAAAIPALSRLLSDWLPGGVAKGKEYLARNPMRNDQKPGSFSVNTEKGAWADFATGDAGGDPVSLYAYLNGMDQVDAARALAEKLGLSAEGLCCITPEGHKQLIT